ALHLRAHSRANAISGDGYLSEEARGSSEDPDSYSYDPAALSLSRGGRSCCLDFVAPMGPMDQRPVESWNGVLVYSSEPLAKERLVAGTVIAHIFAATNQPDTDWVVKLCDVDDSGRSINIQETIQRARFAGGTDRSRPMRAARARRRSEAVASLSSPARALSGRQAPRSRDLSRTRRARR